MKIPGKDSFWPKDVLCLLTVTRKTHTCSSLPGSGWRGQSDVLGQHMNPRDSNYTPVPAPYILNLSS